jgi:endonuclease G
MGTLYGEVAQQASFSMRNISPQSRSLNTRVWQRLEELEMDEVRTRVAAPLYVLTGPVMRRGPLRLTDGVAVPDAFWRVWLRRDDSGWRSLAFIVPQAVQGREDLRQFMVSVDEVEAQAQIDLFPMLDPGQQQRLESQVEWQSWGEPAWWTQQPRY